MCEKERMGENVRGKKTGREKKRYEGREGG